MKQLFFLLLTSSLLFAISCQPDESRKPQPIVGKVTVHFNNTIDGKELVLEADTYSNEIGNRYWIEYLQYYVSNIKMTGCECGPYEEPESYHLIRHLDDPNLGGLFKKTTIEIDSVQAGNYDAIEFSIGVDPVRNSSGEMKGDLEPSMDMFWGWQTGYIFYKIEGGFIDSLSAENKYAFHIGGDGAYKSIRLEFAKNLELKENENLDIYINANINTMFSGPDPIDLNKFSGTVSPGSRADGVADKYERAFSLK